MSVSLFNAVSPRGSAGAPVGAIEVLLDEQNEPWFKRAHVGKFLDIKHIVTSLEGLDDCEQRSRYELKMGSVQNKTDKFLSQQGLKYVINRSRKPARNLEILANFAGIELHQNKWLCKEQDSIQSIRDAFHGESMTCQHHVDGYRIDLYFPEYKLAIECDEFGHRDRDIEYEVKRQKYIEEKLKCSFIRFNPDAPDFNIFRVINRIYQQLC